MEGFFWWNFQKAISSSSDVFDSWFSFAQSKKTLLMSNSLLYVGCCTWHVTPKVSTRGLYKPSMLLKGWQKKTIAATVRHFPHCTRMKNSFWDKVYSWMLKPTCEQFTRLRSTGAGISCNPLSRLLLEPRSILISKEPALLFGLN